MYEVQILDAALADLKRLDKPIRRRVVQRISWLAENLDSIQRERLTGELSEFCKFRVGSYRVLYQVLDDDAVLIIHQIGHRREIYR